MENSPSPQKSVSFSCAAGQVSFREVGLEDAEFLLELYAGTRAEEMALVPWDAVQKEAFVRMQFTAQGNHYREHYPDATHDLVLLDGSPVGRLYVARGDEAVLILDLLLVPARRGVGIGTPIIENLMSEAARAGVPVRIHVETFNPSLRLFKRLGFSEIELQGFHILMEWKGA